MTVASEAPVAITDSIDPAEAAHFGGLAADWWDPKGSSAMLHRLNPVRLRYIRRAIDRQFGSDIAAIRPLEGRRALDMGCGAGLLCEPLARLGAAVTGVDAAPENVAAARLHAEQSGLAIDYHAGDTGALADEAFDLVTCLEVVEHVTDPAPFVRALAAAVAPGGLLVMSTPNRTPLSRMALVEGAERLGLIPRGTHDWHKFLTPEELAALIEATGLTVTDVTGLALSPARGFVLGADRRLNYLVTARR